MPRAAIAIVFVCLAATPAPAQTVQAADPPSITAQGEAILMRAPDRAYVLVSAEGRAAKPADAQKIAADAMTSVQNALRKLSIGSEFLRTTAYTLQPEYDYNNGRQAFRDYLARQTLEIRIDDLKTLPDVLDASGSSGAASVSGLRFELKDKSGAEQEALRIAVRDAVARANAIASGAGKTAGPILRIQEQRLSSPSPMFQAGVAQAAGRGGVAGFSTPIESGDLQVRASVTVVISIK